MSQMYSNKNTSLSSKKVFSLYLIIKIFPSVKRGAYSFQRNQVQKKKKKKVNYLSGPMYRFKNSHRVVIR